MRDQDVVDLLRLFKHRVAVSADNEIHTDLGWEKCRKSLVLLKPDMSQKNCQVDVNIFVAVANIFHLVGSVFNADKCSNQRLTLTFGDNLFGDNADK